MSLERYRVTLSPFVTYYHQFLRNTFLQQRYRIVLRDGEQVEGVPTTELRTDPHHPNVGFNLQAESGFYRIPFIELESAEEL